jgi:hypothetical protein
MIAIIYTGFDRHRIITKDTHNRLFEKLRIIDEVKIYDFTKPNKLRPFCIYDEYDARGAIQIFDLLWALDSIPETLFIKLRSDLWLTDDAINIIVEELKCVKNNKQDLSLLGWHFHGWDFDQPYGKMTTAESGKHNQDFVVIAKKDTIDSKENIFAKMNGRNMGALYSGNKVIRDLIRDHSNAYTVKTHMYLIRDGITADSSIHDIVLTYMASYGGKGKAHPYRDWFIANKQSTRMKSV